MTPTLEALPETGHGTFLM